MYDSIIPHIKARVCLEARGEGTCDVVRSHTVRVLWRERVSHHRLTNTEISSKGIAAPC